MRRSGAASAVLCATLILGIISDIFNGMAVPFAFGKNVDLSNWASHRILLSDIELTFRVPGGEVPSEMPQPPPLARVDLERDITGEKGGIGVFSRAWRYRGVFAFGYRGYLLMAVSVRSVPGDQVHHGVPTLPNLKRIIRTKLEDTYRGQQRGSDLEVTVSDEYDAITLNGREWLKYSLGGFKDSLLYATPLTTTRYLVVHFDFIGNTGGRETKWRQDAQIVVDRIADSLTINKVTN